MPYNGPSNMDELVRYARNRTKRNKHFVMGFEGPPGSGKSEAAILFGNQLQGEELDITTQVAFRPKDRAPMAQRLGRFKVILDDEASGEGGNKLRTMSKDNVEGSMDMDACRGRNQYVLWAAPSPKRVQSAMWDHTMWLCVMKEDHSAKLYELVELGPVDNRYRKPFLRFKVRRMPWLEHTNPEQRAAYLEAKERHMRGGSTDEATTRARLQEKAVHLLNRMM